MILQVLQPHRDSSWRVLGGPGATIAVVGDSPVKTGRDHVGRFRPGCSGNPAGRPKGSRNAATRALAELVDADGAVIVAKLIEQAKAGEPVALRLAVERLLPRLERRVEVEIPRVSAAGDVAGAVADVIALAASGDLTIEEAQAFLRLLEQQRKVIETSDLAVRLQAIEEHQKEGRWD